MVDGESEDTRFVTFLNVGQGDCTLVVDRESRDGLLIDCKASAVREVLRRLRDHNVKNLDVVITHWDADHYTGAVRVAKNYVARRLFFNIDTVRAADAEKESRRDLALRSVQALPAEETTLYDAKEGASGDIGTIRWSLLSPTHRELVECINANDRNHASAIVFVEGAGAQALIGGDADGRVWARLIGQNKLPKATVLRCSHHGGELGLGSLHLSERDLYDVVQPVAVVISTGTTNSYGHPFEPTVLHAGATGIRVMCTQATVKCGTSNAVHPCAGDVTLFLNTGLIVPDVARHREAMVTLEPLCI